MSSAIVTGDDENILIQLYRDSATFTIDPTATVKAAVVNAGRSAIMAGPVTCLSDATGADWTTALVAVNLTSAQTAAITRYGSAILEVEVEDSAGKQTYSDSVTIVRGLI